MPMIKEAFTFNPFIPPPNQLRATQRRSTKSGEYNIERINKGNLKDISKLYAAIHKKPGPPNLFIKYNTEYTDAAYLGFIAYNSDHLPVACYTVIPCFIKHNEQFILSAQTADVMTHPQYRHKGLFVQLANLTTELCCKTGIKVIFALSHEHLLYNFLIKLEWQFTETMKCFILPVCFLSFKKLFMKLPFSGKVYGMFKKQVLKKYVLPLRGISNSVLGQNYAGVYRDDHYLDCKNGPNLDVIAIKTTLIWIKITDRLIIGDISGMQDDFDHVIHKLRKLAFLLGLSGIEFHVCNGTKLGDLLIDSYDSTSSFHIIFKDLGAGIPLKDIKFTLADSDIF